MFCSNCGSENEVGAKFCGNCGTPININSTLTTSEELPKEITNDSNFIDNLVDSALCNEPTPTPPAIESKHKKKKYIPMISIAIISILVIGGGIYYFFFSNASIQGDLKKAVINQSFSHNGVVLTITEDNLKKFDLDDVTKTSDGYYKFTAKIKLSDKYYSGDGYVSGTYLKIDKKITINSINSFQKDNFPFTIELNLDEEMAIQSLKENEDIKIKDTPNSYNSSFTLPLTLDGTIKVKDIKTSNSDNTKTSIVTIDGYNGFIQYKGEFTSKFIFTKDKWICTSVYFDKDQSLFCSIKDITKVDLASELKTSLGGRSYSYSKDTAFLTLYQKDGNYDVTVENVTKDKEDKLEKLTADIIITIDNGDIKSTITGRYTTLIEEGKKIKNTIEDPKVTECKINELSKDSISDLIKIDSKIALKDGSKTLSSNEVASIEISEISYSNLKNATAKGTIKLSNTNAATPIELSLVLDYLTKDGVYKWVFSSISEK